MAAAVALAVWLTPGGLTGVRAFVRLHATQAQSPTVADGAREGNRRLAERAFAEGESLRAQWTAEALRGALESYKKSLRLWRLAGDAAAEIDTLNTIGDVHYSVGDSAGALDFYNQALAASRAASDRRGEARSLNNVCYTQSFVGESKRALDSCRAALAIGRELADDGLVGQSLSNLGRVYYSLSDMGQALELFGQALPLLRATGQRRTQAQALLNSGYTYANVSDVTRALAAYNDALPLWRAVNDKRGEALTLAAFGHLYNKLEEKQTALGFYDQAMKLFRLMGDRYGEANTLNGIAFVYRKLGERENALEYYNRALGLYRLTSYRAGQALALISCGRVYYDSGDYRNALSSFQQALSISRGLDDPLIESYALGYLGKLSHSQGDNGAALEFYNRALQLNRAGQDKREEAYILNNIGHVYAGAGDRAKALECFRQALALHELVSDPGGMSSSYYDIAGVERDRGNFEESRAAVAQALKISEDLRVKVTGQDLRATYFATVYQQFDLYLDVLMHLHQARPAEGFDVLAFEAAERSRARSLLETLAEARSNIRQGVAEELLGRERELQRQLNAKAERQIQLAVRKAPAAESAAVERELGELTAEYQRVQGQIRASSPRYAALVQPSPLTLREIQQKVLDRDTVLLEYALGEKRSFVWVVTPDSLKSFELPPRAEVERAARFAYERLTARVRQVKDETGAQWQERIRKAEAEYADAAAELGRMLLGPVAAGLEGKRLVVVADGALQYVPFAALPVTTDGRAGSAPLLAGHEVVSLPSASVLALMREELRARRPAPKSVAILADPVFDSADERLATAGRTGKRAAPPPRDAANADVAQRAFRSFEGLGEGSGLARLVFSQREAKAIMAAAGDGMLAVGFRASRATAMSPELAQYRVVHFATHGLLNSEHPELSGIVLSLFNESGRRQDGFLQLHEVYNLNLSADLVVLSACQTALGKDVRGEGLVGLTRGFMYAGAARVVAGLWKVDDAATAELMGEFYREMLGKGLRPAEALRAAQLHLSQQPRWRSPYFWAAFTLQGEWR